LIFERIGITKAPTISKKKAGRIVAGSKHYRKLSESNNPKR